MRRKESFSSMGFRSRRSRPEGFLHKLTKMTRMKDFLTILVLLMVLVGRSDCVRCFGSFDQTTGQCNEELGEVDEDECCQNTKYGFQDEDGKCHSCGPPAWSSWSPWSKCNVLCGEGVRQRTRKCYGIDETACDNPDHILEVEPCSGTCCQVKGWGPWDPWSACSISCGTGGVQKRQRVCLDPTNCHLACKGPEEETGSCPTQHTCPVHGGWSSWSTWSQCSGSCLDSVSATAVTRKRHRSCTNPAPSSNTVLPGDVCPGDPSQLQECSELPNCPVNGNWGEWSQPGPCSASCGEGLQLMIRKCDNPAPKYGGKYCDGQSTQSAFCKNACPVDGSWSGWSSWGECSASCITDRNVPIRKRQRFCTNPPPSLKPHGQQCDGDSSQMEKCMSLPPCAINGGWGSWSPFSSCSVTCGVGLKVSIRSCDKPAPKHGGHSCAGEQKRTEVCNTNVNCPVDGVWSEWSPWEPCRYPFGNKNVRCQKTRGRQMRQRECLYRAHNGSICSGEDLTQLRACYDINACFFKGNWGEWEPWSLCKPSCGENSRRIRKRMCIPDYGDYRPINSRNQEKVAFFGTPVVNCVASPDVEPYQIQPCINVPVCT